MISSPLNWFTLAGLFPLSEGVNRVGCDEECGISLPNLPQGSSASLEVRANEVFLVSHSPEFTVNDQAPTVSRLRQDIDGQPDLMKAGSITIAVINRNSRPYLRVWDQEAPDARGFNGLRYFSIDPAYRILADYKSFNSPRAIAVTDAIGGEHVINFPGEASFSINGVECVLIAEDDEDGLLFNFTDLTRMDATYPGGRYLLVEKPESDPITLDFNLARNWPCAYTAFATCPLPPSQNHLMVRIEAGEMRYHD